MIGDIDKAKADLSLLSCRIQSAHNHEVRYAMERTKLEAERSRLQAFVDLAEMVQRYQTTDSPPLAPPLPVSGTSLNGGSPDGSSSNHAKPPGLPSIAKMVVAALEDAAKHGQAGLKSGEITAAVRKVWPEARGVVVSSSAWHLAKSGKLHKDGALYKLNGHAP